jgi:hypothetical protein
MPHLPQYIKPPKARQHNVEYDGIVAVILTVNHGFIAVMDSAGHEPFEQEKIAQ